MAADSLAASDGAPAPPPAISVRQLIMAAIIVALVAAALGAGFALRPGLTSGDSADKTLSGGDQQTESGAQLFDLRPIVTNLGSPNDTWIRLETSMIFDPKSVQNPDLLGGQIADDLLAYLRTVALSQIQGPIGLQNLRQELNERASIRSSGKVKELIIRTLVVQ